MSLFNAWAVRDGDVVSAPPAPVAKTGQTTSYATGDDGDYEKGVASPSPRFIDNGDSTVTDNLTGLMWAKNANLGGTMTWNDALSYANSLSLGISCGTPLTDWRMPNVNELQSLLDRENYIPALPTSHPFSNVPDYYYWSSSTSTSNTSEAWTVYISYGSVSDFNKTTPFCLWPVRGGN